jgi:hypothetical protein
MDSLSLKKKINKAYKLQKSLSAPKFFDPVIQYETLSVMKSFSESRFRSRTEKKYEGTGYE